WYSGLRSVVAGIFLPERNRSWTGARPLANLLMTELDKDEQLHRDTETIAFPKLDDRELAMLEPLGARRIIRRGELVFKAGQRNLRLTAVLRGELEVFDSRDGKSKSSRLRARAVSLGTLRCLWAPHR